MDKSKKKEKTYTRKRLNSIILLLAFAAIMLIVSTYAWFSTQRNVSITNLAGTVQVAEGMEISLDGLHFKQTLDLSQVTWTDTTGTTDYPVYAGNTNNIPEELQPVSRDGSLEGTADLTFYKGNFTTDGMTLRDVVATAPAVQVTDGVGAIKYTAENKEGTASEGDAIPAASAIYPGYYAFDVFIKNTIQAGSTGTSNHGTAEAPNWGSNLQLNYDSFAKVLEKATGDGNRISTIDWNTNISNEELETYTSSGVQNTLRIGFATYSKAGSATPSSTNGGASNSTLDATVADAASTIRQFAIWEPNSAQHVESIVSELEHAVLWDKSAATELGSGSGVYYNAWTATSPMTTYGVKAAAVNNSITNIYNWVVDSTADGYRGDAYLGAQYTNQTTPLALKEDADHPDTITGYNYNELNEGVINKLI